MMRPVNRHLLLLALCQGLFLTNNVVFKTGYEGLSLLSTAFGPQNVVQGNAIWQTGEQGIYIEGSVLVQNNLIFETGDDGIETNDGYGEESLFDVQISHNTIARTEGWVSPDDLPASLAHPAAVPIATAWRVTQSCWWPPQPRPPHRARSSAAQTRSRRTAAHIW